MRISWLAGGVALSALALATSGAYAQEITGAIAGQVTESGHPVGGAKVEVTNTGTGATYNAVSAGNGFYTVRNLPPGGPYTVKVTTPDSATSISDVDQVQIGAPYQLDVVLGSAVSEVTVSAAPRSRAVATIQTGPRTTFTATEIAHAPSFGGDLHDLARINPFVTIDQANSNAMIIAGANNHFNTIYLDGVRQSDDFGLNNNGYPTQRSPFSLGIIQAMNVEVAPYDVQYGNFQGGILNVVTKSGTNQFHGGIEWSYDSDQFSGHRIGAQALLIPNASDRTVTTKFHDEAVSANFGGPIWPDHLFFFFGYDRYTGTGAATFNPQDVAGANPIAGVTQANVTTVQNILSAAGPTGYGYNPLNYGGTQPVIDQKWFTKFDFYPVEGQHFWFSYQNTSGTSYNVPSGSTANKILNLASNDYILGQTLIAYTGDWTAHWTPNFSTEIEYTQRDVTSPTILQTDNHARFQIQLPSSGNIYLGTDISRQANNLGVFDKQIKFKGHLTLVDHVITAGYERERIDEFDLFVQNATGDFVFSSACGAGDALINLANHQACSLTYQNAFDNNPITAASTATYFTDVLYGEDEWHVTPELTLSGGLRYESYHSPTAPQLNPRFVNQYGYANNLTIDGESILLPRIGFNWRPDPTWTITGGFGLFSGGNPGVYTYNSYTNPGNITGTKTYRCTQANCDAQATALTLGGVDPLKNVTGAIPLSVQQDITSSANLGTGIANALDPNFKPPATWKASLSIVKTVDFTQVDWMHGIGTFLGDGWRFHGDVLWAKVQNGVLWQDVWGLQNQLTAANAAAILGSATASPNGTAPDGRPLFNPARYTNSLNRTSGSDILLTTTKGGDTLVWAIGVGRSFPWGLDVDYTYTGQHVRDVSAATSSVATSNYNNLISADPNHPALSTSGYEIKYEHRLNINFSHRFFGDYKTTIRLFLYERAGLPFSYGFCTTNSSSCISGSSSSPADQLFGQANTSTNHQLLYVPAADSNGNVTTGSDPLVRYQPGFDVAAFNTFLHQTGLIRYAGQISPRNAFKSRDYATGDIQFAQEIPGGFPHGAKGELYISIINFVNLMNKNWGIDNQVGFPYVFAPVVAYNCQWSGKTFGSGSGAVVMPSCVTGQGNYYQYNTLRPQVTAAGVNQFSTVQTLNQPPVATWAVKFGVRYKF